MSTLAEAGLFALISWTALWEDIQREKLVKSPSSTATQKWLDYLRDDCPATDVGLYAVHELPELGRWFDACISQQTFAVQLPERWRQHVIDGGQLPFVEDLFPDWFETRTVVLGMLVTEPPAWPLDPDRVFYTRQALMMHKKFEVRFKEGSDVEVISEFWFCGSGPSAFSLRHHVRKGCGGRRGKVLRGIESIGLRFLEESDFHDGPTCGHLLRKLRDSGIQIFD